MVAVSADTRRETSVKYTYEPTGSGDGKAQVVAGSVHFAGSDSALSAKEKLAVPNAWFVPSLAGGVAVGFNVPGIGSEELSIPREALADVFLGKIRQWSGLASWNPKLENVSNDISIIVRSESSGTTSTFTSALSSFSAEWKNKTGSSSLPKWPVAASKREGNAGVAIGIRLTPYSIGYLNVADANTYGVTYAKIANAAGRYISPTLQAVQAATNSFAPKLEALGKNGSTNFYVDTVDPKGDPEAYPISTFTYIAFSPSDLDCQTLFDVVYLRYLVFDAGRLDCETMLDVLFMVYWAWSDKNAAKMATDQSLSPITADVRAILLNALTNLKCEGEYPMGQVQRAFGLGCQPGAKWPLLHCSFCGCAAKPLFCT
jgi:phosphate ABC transporter phosphate-binding protein